jgi:hypothetical protein
LVVEGGRVGIGVVYFKVDLVLTQAADVDPLRCAVAAAEADGGFVKQQTFQVGIGAFVDFLRRYAVGGKVGTFNGNGLKLGGLGGCVRRVGEAAEEG